MVGVGSPEAAVVVAVADAAAGAAAAGAVEGAGVEVSAFVAAAFGWKKKAARLGFMPFKEASFLT